jgi:hypothetical protein
MGTDISGIQREATGCPETRMGGVVAGWRKPGVGARPGGRSLAGPLLGPLHISREQRSDAGRH